MREKGGSKGAREQGSKGAREQGSQGEIHSDRSIDRDIEGRGCVF